MTTPYRLALESDALSVRDHALVSLLDAGVTPTEVSRLRRVDVVRARGQHLAVRIVGCRSCESSRRGRQRFVVLDPLQSAYLRRYLEMMTVEEFREGLSLFCGRGTAPLGVRGVWAIAYKVAPKEAEG